MRHQLTIKLKDELLLDDEETSQSQETGKKGKSPRAQEQDPGPKRTFGSDAGKIFRFTQMPALKLETWYMKMYSIVYTAANASDRAAMEEARASHSSAAAVTSTPIAENIINEVSSQIRYTELMNEFFSCYEYYEPSTDRYVPVSQENIDEYLDNLTSIRYLRDRAVKENLKGFI